ncbi:MAG: ABC transporter substrate-binding protein [Bosea sp. (in: a-proteobacteria)]
MSLIIHRRQLLAGAAAGTALLAAPAIVRAQAGPIRIGTLTPLTGSGGQYGPGMANVVKAVADEVNAAGGVLGRQIQVISEDDQTNAEAGVRAARKLIDVDKVTAIMGTWASAVTTAVAPLCWESKTFLFTVSGADSITQLPHNGWLVRTQPNTTLQGRKFAEFCLEVSGGKRAFFMMPQTPFTQSTFNNFKIAYDKVGGATELLIYDDKKPSLRTEVDQAMRYNADCIFVGGYLTDTTVLMRDLFRAGYKGKIVGPGYSINQKLVDNVGQPEATEGAYGMLPSPQEGSAGWKKVADLTKQASPDPFACQIYDHVNMALMAMAQGKDATGQGIRDNVRKVSQGGGDRVDNAVDGLKAIVAGKKVDYDGASGPCDFTDLGDISEVKFRYEQVKAGKMALVRIA